MAISDLPAVFVLVLGISALLCWVTVGTAPWMVRWSLGRRALDKTSPENQAEVVRAAIGEAQSDLREDGEPSASANAGGGTT